MDFNFTHVSQLCWKQVNLLEAIILIHPGENCPFSKLIIYIELKISYTHTKIASKQRELQKDKFSRVKYILSMYSELFPRHSILVICCASLNISCYRQLTNKCLQGVQNYLIPLEIVMN